MFTFHHIVDMFPLLIPTTTLLIVNLVLAESKMAAYYGPMPEPEPGQPYNKYHWVASAMQKIRNECPRSGTANSNVCSIDSEEPLGMKNGEIPDENIITSSGNPGHFARPNEDGWCDTFLQHPWIQVNFTAPVYITGLITQGSEMYRGRVTSYSVLYSADGEQWMQTDPNEFTGNTDTDSNVTASFTEVLYTRYIRIVPIGCNDYCCMRFELMGCK